MLVPIHGANMPKPIDLSGQRFGKLIAEERAATGRIRSWACKCDCGERTIVGTNKLTSGHTRSCGCIKVQSTLTNGFKNRVHGRGHGKRDLSYRTWTSMRERCRDGYKGKEHYWKRGISVCDRWNVFENFLADMGERLPGMTLDRINVNGNYEPGNCRWATASQQQRNKQKARYLLIDGQRCALMDVADLLGIRKNAAQAFFSVAIRLKERYGHVPSVESGLPVDSYGADRTIGRNGG